jgi:hypothetical protein
MLSLAADNHRIYKEVQIVAVLALAISGMCSACLKCVSDLLARVTIIQYR